MHTHTLEMTGGTQCAFGSGQGETTSNSIKLKCMKIKETERKKKSWKWIIQTIGTFTPACILFHSKGCPIAFQLFL